MRRWLFGLAVALLLGWGMLPSDVEASSCLTRNNLTALPNGSLAPVVCNQYGQLYAVNVNDDGTQTADAGPPSLLIPVRYESPYLYRTAGSAGLTCTTSGSPTTYPIGQAVPLACNQYGQLLVDLSGAGVGAILESTVAGLPGSPPSGTVRIVTDGTDGSDCTTGASGSRALCGFDGSTWAALGGGASTLQQAFDGGNTISGATEATPLKIRGSGAQSANGWNFYQHSNGTPTIKCVVAEVEGDCDVTVSLNAGKKYLIKDSLGTTLFTVDEATGDVTIATAGQLIASNLGIEFAESDTNPPCAAGNYNIYADTSEGTIKMCRNALRTSLISEGTVRKTSDQIISSDAVPDNDADLNFAVEANSNYTIEMLIKYSSDSTADFLIDFTYPAGASGTRMDQFMASATTDCSSSIAAQYNIVDWTTSNSSIGGESTTAMCIVHIVGELAVAGTAGTFQFQWSQAVSTATNTTLRANSWLHWRKL